ncbi:phosphorylase domain protein [Mycobacterium xenopi 4042]|uniref:Phosphorylase domain protein n=1 Tax=Mycobacterium xenopi 4042 TaxID=1299334 RepID=X8E585_MYCXE|nr:phosphorylase domain protein [Mycobacterium xenopi 4042]
MGGEHRAGPHDRERGVEIQPESVMSSRMRSTPRKPAWPSFM